MTQKQTRRPALSGWEIDATATLPWFFPEEATPFAEEPPDAPGTQTPWAPTLSVIECTNHLQRSQRQRRIDVHSKAEITGELDELSVRMDIQTPDFASLDRLAATHGLSAYDAAYHELALRRTLVPVSLDERLIAAAKALGHPVLSAPTDASN